MNFKRYNNASEFMAENTDFLYQNEAANNLIIGIAKALSSVEKMKEDILLCSIINEDETLFVSIMTPPHDLIISSKNLEKNTISLLIKNLIEQEIHVPGVIAQYDIADFFCTLWKQNTGNGSSLFRRERIHQLFKCNDIREASGYFKVADEGDTDLIAGWIVEFCKEVDEKITLETARKMSETKIKDKNIHLWIDDMVVSMCGSARETHNGKAINYVYTPQGERKKGYATSCVHSLCRKILEEGKSFCCLFTDLSNPTSNSIYRKIGFNPLMDFLHYRFK